MPTIMLVLQVDDVNNLPEAIKHFSDSLISDIKVLGVKANAIGSNPDPLYNFDYDIVKNNHTSIVSFIENEFNLK